MYMELIFGGEALNKRRRTLKYFITLKSILLTTSLTLSLSSFVPSNAFAATYTAVSGDSLYKISQIFSTSITTLMTDNNLANTSLNIGQVLNLHSNTYTVQKGDSLYLIAKKFKITLATLRRANNIYNNYIDIGQELNIPILPTATTTSETTYSESDLDLLARLIMAEAQGEPYEAMVAVGAIVMNRVNSSSFPNTISEVIYQNINGYYQFTPVLNGWINKPANSDCIKAAKVALSGVDTTDGCLFYYDNTTTNTWILAKPVSITEGNMIFAY